MQKILYRSEDSYGSGVRDIIQVMTYEIYELGNTDILEYVCEHYLTGETKNVVTHLIYTIENGEAELSENDIEDLCENIIDEINKKTNHNLKYALWLADKNVVEDMYADDELNIDAYYISDIILADLGYDGILFAYDEEPEPIETINEAFRDYDDNIGEVEDELYDLITSVDSFNNISDILTYEFDENEFYEDDIKRGKALQQRLKMLYDLRKKEYDEEIKQLPPKTTKTNFEGFDITKTDPPYDEQMLEGSPDRDYLMKKNGFTNVYIAEMTPDDYLLLCGKYGWGKIFNSVEDIYNSSGVDKNKVNEYVTKFKNGEKAPMPVLNVLKQGQEGRHRAFAAKLAGIETIPVLIEV